MIKIKGKKKVFVGLSGGVDSSVTALLLQKGGYDVTGVFIRSYNIDGCAERDVADARLVANNLGIPFYVFDFEREYKRDVVDYMIRGYRAGLTPNPDVMCNKYIKFGLFLEKALGLGADYIATGHYVRRGFRIQNLEYRNGNEKSLNPKSYILYSAKDSNKDQSYFLWTLTQDQIKHSLFPIGGYLKPEVRLMAKQAGLPTAEKKDSQGICFLGKVTIGEFLKDYIPEKRGSVLTTANQEIGEHNGAQFYTIGQRHGLDLKIKNYALGIRGSHATKPHYIAAKDMTTNTIVVAEGENNPALYKKDIGLADANFINPESLEIRNSKLKIPVLARVRYRQPLAPAILHKSKTGNHELIFDVPVKFVAPGQSAVFYSKNGEMLGGGIII